MSEQLVVVWTSGDPEVAKTMVFMYTLNAKKQGWFDEVTFVVWGPSARLLAGEAELRDQVDAMLEAGVVVEACRRCAEEYDVASELESMGIDVRYMGSPLSAYLKEGRRVLTF